MTPRPDQTLEDLIRDDVLAIVTMTGRLPKLCYLVHPEDMAGMVKRLGARVEEGRIGATFELNTSGGIVEVMADKWHPRGCTHKFVFCACGSATMFAPGSSVDRCVSCRRTPFQPLLAQPEPAFRLHATDGALYVDTPNGPIKITSDSTAPPDQAPVITTCRGYNAVFHIEPDPPDLAQCQAARVAEQVKKEVERLSADASSQAARAMAALELQRQAIASHLVNPIDLYRGVDRAATPEKLSGAVLAGGPVPIDWANLTKKASAPPSIPPPVDPLDVKYDGITLGCLISFDEARRLEHDRIFAWAPRRNFTPAQRAAVSAHWSAELRAKVAASSAAALESERHRITCDPRDPIDLED